MKVELRKISSIAESTLNSILTGYESNLGYSINIQREQNEKDLTFKLAITRLSESFVKSPTHLDSSTLKHYNEVAAQGYSYGAFQENSCVGFILADRQEWNKSLVVREFGVGIEFRRQGIGEKLISKVVDEAKEHGLRCIVCETQTTNVPAIQFYQKMGFNVEGVDVALYTNSDLARGEVAIFLRRKV